MLKIEQITSKIKVKEEVFSPFKSRYVLEPLYRGYGNTIGNALRRVLLSSIPGCAIRCVKIDGVVSEFSVVEGVKETLVDILLNLKSIVLKAQAHGEHKMHLSVKGPALVTAADIKHSSEVEIINKDQVIAEITGNTTLSMEIIADTGEGFLSSEDMDKSTWAAGFLAVDALYSPVKGVSYLVEDTMVGRVTNFDKLTIDLETNGSLESKDIMSYAVELLMSHFTPLLEIGNRVQHLREELENVEQESSEGESSLPELRIEDLDLSVRSYNCLKKSNIDSLRELARLSSKDLLNIKNLGKSSMSEIIAKLGEFGVKIS